MKGCFKLLSFLALAKILVSCGTSKKIIQNEPNITLETHTYFTTNTNQKLALDFYKSTLFKKKLPLIIYVHGGGFSGGARDDDFVQRYSIEMAKNGFAVAAISYRLTMKKYGFGCNTATNLKISAFNTASEDISLATNYILAHQKKLGIDANKIILVGSSAGAEAILNLVYVYENNILPKSFSYAGMIAMGGAIVTLAKINSETAIPTQFFHGVLDDLVPYHIAPHHYCAENTKGYLPLFGSKAIADKLKELHKSYYLFTVEDGDHSWNAKPMYLNIKEMLSFIDVQILQKQHQQIEVLKKESNHNVTPL